eukprot:gene27817-33593_t
MRWSRWEAAGSARKTANVNRERSESLTDRLTGLIHGHVLSSQIDIGVQEFGQDQTADDCYTQHTPLGRNPAQLISTYRDVSAVTGNSSAKHGLISSLAIDVEFREEQPPEGGGIQHTPLGRNLSSERDTGDRELKGELHAPLGRDPVPLIDADRNVFFRICHSVYNIDGVGQVVEFGTTLFLRWVDANHATKGGSLNLRKIKRAELKWQPSLLLWYTIERSVIGTSVFVRESDGTVVMCLDYLLKVRELLELGRFPFDRQCVKLTITSDCNMQIWDIDKDADLLLPSVFSSAVEAPFSILCRGSNWRTDRIDVCMESSSELSIIVYLSRNPSFYVWNFISVYFVIGLLSLTSAVIPYSSFSERSSITLTLLLTSVAFKFVAAAYIPIVPYITFLDGYILSGIFLIAAVSFENVIVCLVTTQDDGSVVPTNWEESAKYIDRIVYCVLFSIWVAAYLVILFGAYRLKLLTKSLDRVKREDDADEYFYRAQRAGTFRTEYLELGGEKKVFNLE